MDHLLQETKRIRPLTNQVAYNTFIVHGRGQCALPTGPKVIYVSEVFVVAKLMKSASRNTVVGTTSFVITCRRLLQVDLSKCRSLKPFFILTSIILVFFCEYYGFC